MTTWSSRPTPRARLYADARPEAASACDPGQCQPADRRCARPVEGPGTWAVESAMDELAHALGIDPLDLRLRNVADADPATGKALVVQQAARGLRGGRAPVRLARPAARRVRRALAHRTWHGELHHGHVPLAGQGAGAPAARRLGNRRDQHARHRLRHLHDHAADRGRHARPRSGAGAAGGRGHAAAAGRADLRLVLHDGHRLGGAGWRRGRCGRSWRG